jgi:hypothetical protein
MLDSFFPECHPISTKDMLPLKPKIFYFVTSIKHIMCPFWLGEITITFTLIFWTPFAFERQIFTKLRAEKHSADHTII